MRCCRAGLPISTLSVSLHFCEACSTYEGRVDVHRQADGDDIEMLYSETITFGPFDSWQDVTTWIARCLPPDGLAPT